ncbi:MULTISPECIES: hypothetical protein [unclassified Mesorhizobium]|uniref:hypothetical protein n=1 Tax=unclassified Mesorhizobium TaxID=325217 RepID=UPI0013E3885A|nr:MULTISPECIES: hypothetical protein [unclassified Mesorhizobium]
MEPILRDFLGNDGSAMAGRQLLNFQQLEGFGFRRRTAELFHHQRPRLSFDGRDQDESRRNSESALIGTNVPLVAADHAAATSGTVAYLTCAMSID